MHAETSCHYKLNGSTHKSMLAAISLDQGASFTDYGQIITGQDSPVEGLVTGIGDCQMVRWMDDYLYAYCLRASDSKVFSPAHRCQIHFPAHGSSGAMVDGIKQD